jgi:hypothetical protein
MAVRVLVDVVMTMLVRVDVPKAKRNLFGLPSGTVKPDSTSNGIREDSSIGVFATSKVGSPILYISVNNVVMLSSVKLKRRSSFMECLR